MKTNAIRVSVPFLLRMALACQTVATVYRQDGFLFGAKKAQREIDQINAGPHNANELFIRHTEEYADPEAIVYELSWLADDEIPAEEKKSVLTTDLLGRVYACLSEAELRCTAGTVDPTMDQYDTISNGVGEIARKIGVYFTYKEPVAVLPDEQV